jgi:cob(I)alamin adenosyltransferase
MSTDELSAIVSQAHALIRKAERKMGELIELQEKQTGLVFKG